MLDFFGDGVVGITVLDADGWEVKEGEWGDKEVARGLFYVAGVPDTEAAEIEARVLAAYVARGGNPTGTWESDHERRPPPRKLRWWVKSRRADD